MRITYLLFVLLIFVGCKEDELAKQCPSEYNFGFVETPSVFFDFIPYNGDEVLTFSNENGEEITFFPKIDNREVKECQWRMKCSFDDNDTILVKLAYDERVVSFCTGEDWCIGAKNSVYPIYGHCFDIESDNSSGFLLEAEISIGLNSDFRFATGLIQQILLDEEEPGLTFGYDIDSLKINGVMYKKLYSHNPIQIFHFKDVIIAKDVGIVQFKDSRNHIWSLKK